MPAIPSLAVLMQSHLLRSWNCNGIQTASNIPALGGEMAVACESISTKSGQSNTKCQKTSYSDNR